MVRHAGGRLTAAVHHRVGSPGVCVLPDGNLSLTHGGGHFSGTGGAVDGTVDGQRGIVPDGIALLHPPALFRRNGILPAARYILLIAVIQWLFVPFVGNGGIPGNLP